MKLSELFPERNDVEISGLCLDSRKVNEGDMFFCLKGLETDGHKYAEKAVQGGAVAVVHEEELANKTTGAEYIRVENVLDELNRITNLFYGSPSEKMTVYGVTGTNGKTTTTSIIRDVLNHFRPCGYMGTIAVRYGDVSRVPSLTTPDQIEIHSNLKDMVDYEMEAVAMEVSSHGLAMHRVDSVDFDVVAFTNLTYDHLDYHKTMENYFDAKKLLFSNMKKSGVAVLNADDMSFDQLRRICTCPWVSYGIREDADYMAKDIVLKKDGTCFTLTCGRGTYAVKTNLVAEYNLYNLLAAIASMAETGVEVEKIIPYLENITQVDGRMEIIDMGQEFHAIVDYAHTPDGFEKVFRYGREITESGNIIAVFGCAGKRDKVKRKVLGRIAGQYCSKVIVTEEDPRNERAEDIGEEILAGVKESGNGEGVFIKDRYQAIAAAIEGAAAGDCVLILGKGDEKYMYYEEGRRPWMGDNDAVRKEINEKYC